MKKILLTLTFLFAAHVALLAQTFRSETIFCQGQENSVDTRRVVWKCNNTVRMRRMPATTTRSTDELAVRWIDRIENLPDHLREFYGVYGEKVHAALDGELNYLVDPQLAENIEDLGLYYVPMKVFCNTLSFSFPRDASSDIIYEAAYSAVEPFIRQNWETTDHFMMFTCFGLTYDYPEAFWLNSYFRWGYVWTYRFSYNPSTGQGMVTYEQTVYFTLKSDDFDHRRNEFCDLVSMTNSIQEFNDRVDSILKNSPQGSRYDKVQYFNHWLTHHNSYNTLYGKTDDLPTIMFSPLSALRESTGEEGPVCEGYSRAFKILCDRSNIPCVLAVGFAKGSVNGRGESHMWNEVQMENQNWYAVDVTWNDPITSNSVKVSGRENENWLLLGSEDIVAPGLTFAKSHPISITWDIDSEDLALWQFDIHSFITDHKYDPLTGITSPTSETLSSPYHVFSLSGQYIGTFRSWSDVVRSASHQMVIVNGRKIRFNP